MTIRVRFAPSPTGWLHVGNLRIALLNWLLAHCNGGTLLLRLDDTDAARSTAAYADALLEDLTWLGLTWDTHFRQSARGALYDNALQRLRRSGRLYPCYETAEELARARLDRLRRGAPPAYDRAALFLDAAARQALEAAGRVPHWRFRLDDRDMTWIDRIRGPVRFAPGHVSDPVLVREDGQALYTLTSVVDDGTCGITDVIRGEDHLTNTAAQEQLFTALGFATPRFAHSPLLADAQGRPLSKRTGAASVRDLRTAGIEPLAAALYLTGRAPANGIESLADLSKDFDLAATGRARLRFDTAALAAVNARVVSRLSPDAVRARLRALGVPDAAVGPFWLAVRENVATVAEADFWRAVCFGATASLRAEADGGFLDQAAALLPEDLDAPDSWERWITASRNATGRRGRALFQPLRLALTGRDVGPEMRTLLPLMTRARAAARLRGFDDGPVTP